MGYRIFAGIFTGILRSHETVYPAGKSLTFATDHFTVVCSVTWPLIDSEAGRDLMF